MLDVRGEWTSNQNGAGKSAVRGFSKTLGPTVPFARQSLSRNSQFCKPRICESFSFTIGQFASVVLSIPSSLVPCPLGQRFRASSAKNPCFLAGRTALQPERGAVALLRVGSPARFRRRNSGSTGSPLKRPMYIHIYIYMYIGQTKVGLVDVEHD